MATYYVDTASSGGDGTTTATSGAQAAFATVAAAQAALTGDQHDNSLLFKRGCTWREQFTVGAAGTAGHPFTVGKYGTTGADPIISGADLVTGWSVPPAGGETGGLFVADAEDGGTADFTGVTTAGTATFAAGAVANNGSYGYTATSDGASNAFGYKTFDAQGDMYLRFYVRVKSGFNISGTYVLQQIFSLKNAAGNMSMRGAVYEQAEGHFYIYVNMPWGGYVSGTSAEISLDTWYRVEAHFKVDGSVGGGQAWLNGTSFLNNFTLNTTSKEPVKAEIGISTAINISGAGSVVYFDDVKADTSPIGAYGGGAGAPEDVYQATVAYTPTIVIGDGTKLTKVANLASITEAGEWFYDSGATLLYVRTADSGDPTGDTIEADVRDQCILVNAKPDITVTGLTLTGAHSSCVWVYGVSHRFTITNCAVTNYTTTTGSGIWATGVLIEGGTGGTVGPGNTVTYGHSGITVEGWGTNLPANTTITGNTIHEMTNAGIVLTNGGTGDPTGGVVEKNLVYNCVLTEDDAPGISTYHVGAGTIIRYNVVHSCGSASARGSGINIDALSAATAVYYNVVYLNNYGGINLTASGHFVYGNTCYHNNEGTANAGEISLFTQEGTASSNTTIKNNILVASANKQALVCGTGNTTGHVIDYNCWYGGAATPFTWGASDYSFANYKTASSQDANSLNSDPAFTNAAGGDFTLQAGSPCIDAGVDLGTDYQMALAPGSTWP